MRKRKLGKHLEWHGNRIRVAIRVPPSQVERIGRTQLKDTLETTDPLEAEREKVDVIRAMRAEIAGEKAATVKVPLTQQALQWREAAQEEKLKPDHHGDQTTIAEALSDRVEQIEAMHGRQAALAFAAVASGKATPLRAYVEDWFEEKSHSAGYKSDVQRAIARLEAWCASTATPPTIEAIAAGEAGLFCHAQYIRPKTHYATANKDISCLHSYWKWLGRRRGFSKVNPWDDQRIDPPNHRHAIEGGEKRPFTDDEVTTLLSGIRIRRDFEFSLFAALSGLRVDEIAMLRVRNCEGGKIAVVATKTPSGKRIIPAHPMLAQLITRRSADKKPDAYLFEELPEQKPNSKRGRSAPISQSFSRERQRLKVDERASEAQRQSNVDFHSWRRWFVRKAVDQLGKAAAGYTPWTIANVVGHKVEGGKLEGVSLPLGMTMGRYPGVGSWEAMTACVNAVSLPPGAPIDREDLVSDVVGGKGLRRVKRRLIPRKAA